MVGLDNCQCFFLSRFSRSGEGLDILYGRRTDLVNDVQFPYRDPPIKCKRTVEGVKKNVSAILNNDFSD